MKFIDYSVNNGLENMRIDEYLLNSAIENLDKELVFRLYGWSPACISLGRNQNDKFINKQMLQKYNIDCVKRLTGGRALLHDNELTYSCVVPQSLIPNGESVIESYKYISNIWIEIFKKLNINLTIGGLAPHISNKNYCMSISTGADLCFANKKFIGSAQCRKQGYILQHGSILLDYDEDFLNMVFNENTNFNNIISLKSINPNISLQNLLDSVKSFFNEASVDY